MRKGIACVGGGGIKRGTLVSFEQCQRHALGMPCDYTPEMIRAMEDQGDREPEVLSVTDLGKACLRQLVLQRKADYFVSPSGEYRAWIGTVNHYAAEHMVAPTDPVFFEQRVYRYTPQRTLISGKVDWASPNEGGVGILRDTKSHRNIEYSLTQPGGLPYPHHREQIETYLWLLAEGCLVGSKGKVITAASDLMTRGLTTAFREEPRAAMYDEWSESWVDPVPMRLAKVLLEQGEKPWVLPMAMTFHRAGFEYSDMSRPMWIELTRLPDLSEIEAEVEERAEVRYRALDAFDEERVIPENHYGTMGWNCRYCSVSELCRQIDHVPDTLRVLSVGNETTLADDDPLLDSIHTPNRPLLIEANLALAHLEGEF